MTDKLNEIIKRRTDEWRRNNLKMEDLLTPQYQPIERKRPEYTPAREEHKVYELAEELNCSLKEACSILNKRKEATAVIQERKWESREDTELYDLKDQLSQATTVEELKPVLTAILDKLWS